MAQKIQVLLIDELDGGEAEGTVRFGLDGVEYEIDLSAEHAEALRSALAPFISAARRRCLWLATRAPAGFCTAWPWHIVTAAGNRSHSHAARADHQIWTASIFIAFAPMAAPNGGYLLAECRHAATICDGIRGSRQLRLQPQR